MAAEEKLLAHKVCARLARELQTSDESGPLKYIMFIRDEIRFEHSVLGNRVSAYVTSQAFLFTAFATSTLVEGDAVFAQYFASVCFPYIMLPIFGIDISVVIWIAVIETCRRIESQRSLLYYDNSPLKASIEALRPNGRGTFGHNRSLMYSKVLPWACASLWMLIYLVGIVWHFIAGYHLRGLVLLLINCLIVGRAAKGCPVAFAGIERELCERINRQIVRRVRELLIPELPKADEGC
jgi:hypothetical protein